MEIWGSWLDQWESPRRPFQLVVRALVLGIQQYRGDGVGRPAGQFLDRVGAVVSGSCRVALPAAVGIVGLGELRQDRTTPEAVLCKKRNSYFFEMSNSYMIRKIGAEMYFVVRHLNEFSL